MNWLLLVIPLLTLLFLLPPLFRPGRDERAERESFLECLRERRRALIQAIRDLDFDRETGKISDEDHEEQRSGLKREVALTIERIREEERKDV